MAPRFRLKSAAKQARPFPRGRGHAWLEERFGWDDVERMARNARGEDAYGLRAEFVRLVRAARDGRSVNE